MDLLVISLLITSLVIARVSHGAAQSGELVEVRRVEHISRLIKEDCLGIKVYRAGTVNFPSQAEL